MNTDYAKWETLAADDDDDEEIVDAVNNMRAQLQRNKRFADEAFKNAEVSSSETNYQKALSSYEFLLAEIDEAYALSPLTSFLDELFISSQLNAACCCIRLGQWDAALAYCNTLLTVKYFCLLKSVQLVRISYFKCRSLLSKEQTVTSNVTQRQLVKEVDVFKELLSKYCDSAEGRDAQKAADFRIQMQNYQVLFQEIDEFLLSSGTNKVKSVSIAELINRATRYAQSEKFDLVIIEYQSCLQHQDISESQYLAIFTGLAQAFMATGNHKQVSCYY